MWHGVFCDTPSMSATCILCILCLVNVCMCVCVEYCVLVCPWVLWVCVCTRKAILCMENICKLSFTWGSRVHELWSLLRIWDNSVKKFDSKRANGVQSTGIGWSVDKIKRFCVHAHAQRCNSGTKWRAWWFKFSPCGASCRRRTYVSPRMTSMKSHCNTVTIGRSVGLRQCYLHELFLIYALCLKNQ